MLGLWIEQNEGTMFWLKVMNALRTRGVGDIQIVVVDELTGFPDAIAAVCPSDTGLRPQGSGNPSRLSGRYAVAPSFRIARARRSMPHRDRMVGGGRGFRAPDPGSAARRRRLEYFALAGPRRHDAPARCARTVPGSLVG